MKSPDIAGSHLGWWKFKDPFHPEFRANFHRQLLARKAELDDPWCIGFFVDNEISWGGPADLAMWTLQSPADQPAKIEMVKRLKAKYGDDREAQRGVGQYPRRLGRAARRAGEAARRSDGRLC